MCCTNHVTKQQIFAHLKIYSHNPTLAWQPDTLPSWIWTGWKSPPGVPETSGCPWCLGRRMFRCCPKNQPCGREERLSIRAALCWDAAVRRTPWTERSFLPWHASHRPTPLIGCIVMGSELGSQWARGSSGVMPRPHEVPSERALWLVRLRTHRKPSPVL